MNIPELMTHGELLRALGEKVRKIREHKGFSRKELSSASGVSTATISRLELHGQATLDVLVKLSQALETQTELLNAFPEPTYSSMDEYIKAKS